MSLRQNSKHYPICNFYWQFQSSFSRPSQTKNRRAIHETFTSCSTSAAATPSPNLAPRITTTSHRTPPSSARPSSGTTTSDLHLPTTSSSILRGWATSTTIPVVRKSSKKCAKSSNIPRAVLPAAATTTTIRPFRRTIWRGHPRSSSNSSKSRVLRADPASSSPASRWSSSARSPGWTAWLGLGRNDLLTFFIGLRAEQLWILAF